LPLRPESFHGLGVEGSEGLAAETPALVRNDAVCEVPAGIERDHPRLDSRPVHCHFVDGQQHPHRRPGIRRPEAAKTPQHPHKLAPHRNWRLIPLCGISKTRSANPSLRAARRKAPVLRVQAGYGTRGGFNPLGGHTQARLCRLAL
jgi:hypothetical protein